MVKQTILNNYKRKERSSNINLQDLKKAIDLIAQMVVTKIEKTSKFIDKKET